MESSASAGLSRAEQRQAFVAGSASSIAAQVAPITGSWSALMALSKFFGWFHGPDALVVVGRTGELQRDLDLGLAFGLAHAGDRELILVLPEGTDEPTRRRLPWIDAAVRLYTHSNGDVMPSRRLSRSEVVAACADPVVTAVHQLGDRSPWVERIIMWADACPELVAAHRSSYLAWHCRGRMVLKVQRRGLPRLEVTGWVRRRLPSEGS